MKKGLFYFPMLPAIKKTVQLFFLLAIFINTSLFAQQIINKLGGTIIMNGPVTMIVKNASFINNGTFTAGTYSNAIFSGSTAYSIGTTGGTVDSTNFYNLYITNSAAGTINPYVGVQDTISVTAGSVSSAGNLTLLSTLARTANVSSTTVAGSISGNVNVQRYIPPKRAWRLLTAPVYNANSIFSSWQNNGNYVAGRGMFVSGPAGTTASPTINGLDYSNTNISSMKSYSNSLATPGYVPVSNTTNGSISLPTVTSAANIGYFVFVRGDRARTNINNTVTSSLTTLTSTGLLQTGPQTFNIPSTLTPNSYVLLGNPYAAPIDFNLVTLTNVNKTFFYTFDPAINTLGAFITMTYDGTKYSPVPAAGSAETSIMQSGQAFFVQTTLQGIPTSVVFNESNKTAASSNNTGFRTMGTTNTSTKILGSMVANLFFVKPDSTLQLADGNLTRFNSAFSDKVSPVEDATKFTNLNESFGLRRHGSTLAVESRPDLSINDTLFFKLWRITRRPYAFVFEPKHLHKTNLIGYLEDKYLKTSKVISLKKPTTVHFVVDVNAASAAADRFHMIFKPELPSKFSEIKGYENNRDIAVEWKVTNENDIVEYIVEKEIEGKGFTKVNTQLVNGSNNEQHTWLDENAKPGDNIYRVKMIGTDGSTLRTENVTVKIAATNTGITIYPNPIKEGKINLQMGNQPMGTYQLSLTNISGQVIYSGRVQNNSSNGNFLINIKPTPANGLYNLQIINPQNKISTQKIIVN